MSARGFTPKASLTPEEKLTAAYMHIIRGVEQQIVADMYRVNIGRVNEAIQSIRAAMHEKRRSNGREGGEARSVKPPYTGADQTHERGL